MNYSGCHLISYVIPFQTRPLTLPVPPSPAPLCCAPLCTRIGLKISSRTIDNSYAWARLGDWLRPCVCVCAIRFWLFSPAVRIMLDTPFLAVPLCFCSYPIQFPVALATFTYAKWLQCRKVHRLSSSASLSCWLLLSLLPMKWKMWIYMNEHAA